MPGIVEQFVKSKLQTKVFLLFAFAYTAVIVITTVYSYLRVVYTGFEESEEKKQIENEIYK